MSEVISTDLLRANLHNEFWDMYSAVRDGLQDSRLAMVMDLSKTTQSRKPWYGYYEAAPHMVRWQRGDTIPTGAFGSVQFEVPTHTFARKIPWHKDDRKDDMTQSLMDHVRGVAQSAGLMAERLFMQVISNGTDNDLLPAVPLAPDGAVMFATTDAGGGNRFGVSSGNLLTGTGVTLNSTVTADYYSAMEQFKLMQDGQGQPLLNDSIIDGGAVIVHPAGLTQIFEETFIQKRQGVTPLAPDAATYVGVTPSNVVQDASRNVVLWPTGRLTGNSWYIFLINSPIKSCFLVTREEMREFASMEGDNNSDTGREKGLESTQYEIRLGAAPALPYAAIKVSNA